MHWTFYQPFAPQPFAPQPFAPRPFAPRPFALLPFPSHFCLSLRTSAFFTFLLPYFLFGLLPFALLFCLNFASYFCLLHFSSALISLRTSAFCTSAFRTLSYFSTGTPGNSGRHKRWNLMSEML